MTKDLQWLFYLTTSFGIQMLTAFTSNIHYYLIDPLIRPILSCFQDLIHTTNRLSNQGNIGQRHSDLKQAPRAT